MNELLVAANPDPGSPLRSCCASRWSTGFPPATGLGPATKQLDAILL